jgi:fluoroquinolone transport system permease protein
MRAVAAIVQLDARSILRDNVMFINVFVSVVTVAVITLLGLLQDRLPGWREWFPMMVALSLIGGPGGFGYLFGLLMVDENDTGVRNALSVTPVRPTVLILTRTAIATAWLCIWPAVTISIMNAAWQVIDLSLVEWSALILSLAILTPALALAIPTLAADKVEALAVFKGLTFITLAPLAMYFIDAENGYRMLFLISPTAWAIHAFEAFLLGDAVGYVWAAGGGFYALLLLLLAFQLFCRNVYKLHA